MSGFRRGAAVVAAAVTVLLTTLLATLGSSVPVRAQPATSAPDGFAPSSTAWTSATAGWVLGWAPCGSGRCATLLRTSDGGATWSTAEAPDVQPSDTGYQTRVFFAERHGRSVGLVTNGEALYASYDGARSWHPLELDGAEVIGGIGANDRSVFVVAHDQLGSEVTTQAFSAPIGRPRWRELRGVSTVSPGSVFSTMSVVAGSGRAVQITTSTYGGVVRLWTALNGHRFRTAYPCNPLSVMYPGLSDDGRQLVLCSSDPGRGRMYKVLRTGDADDHFTTVVGTPPVDGITSDFAVAGDATVAVGATMAGAGLLHMSFDGGVTWATPLVAPDTGPVRDLAFPDVRHGVLVAGYAAIGTSAVYRTTDGGHTWTELEL